MERKLSRPEQHGSLEAGIAVVGIGCRLPGGVESPDDYWRLLRDGVDAISETPAERWNLERFYFPDEIRPGKTQSRWGGYVEGIDRFDPQLFGISPKEASSMDPQQRMLLEVAWRAIEDAGQPIRQMAGRRVAVFVGISSFDYAVAGLSYTDRGVIGSYSNTGSSTSIAANRVSYCFDLRGPSLAVDTACSSSLVALHLACESLIRGDSEMALCGGVNALLLPDFYVGFSQLGVLSPDGRCKTFDARANGYVRSEGAGMVLLKPVQAAIRDRDPIYCVIRSTAINQDGHTPGLTVPSGQAQQQLVQSACRRANIHPSAIQYVEAHGTGTPVGDPIEAAALGAVLGADRDPDSPCLVGSVKTNIGHLEAGAGIASLIKVALALHHREIPPHLHLESPNPEIAFESLGLSVPRTIMPWPRPDAPLLAGINGFGYGGANAHVIVEESPRQLPRNGVSKTQAPNGTFTVSRGNSRSDSPPSDVPLLLPISARSVAALAETAERFANFLRDPATASSQQEIAATAAHRRGHFEYRRAVIGQSKQEWAEQLDELHDEIGDPSRHPASSPLSDFKLDAGLMFVCCGQGTQWWAMGRGLYESNRTYREMIDRCDQEFSKHVDWSLHRELHRDESESRLHQTAIAQPALFALQIALSECWSELGVCPRTVVGHSVGEIAAAYISGALTLADACLVAIERGRTMDLASSGGAMIAVGLSESECEQWIAKLGVEVSIAAINGPTSVTLSGRSAMIQRIESELEAAGIFCKRLAVQYAFHSLQMDPVRDELLRALSTIKPRPTRIDMISTVTGENIDGETLDAEYWWRNVRNGVRFADAIALASQRGFQVAIELGPHPTLTFAINECCQSSGSRVQVVPSLRREQPDIRRFAESVALLYTLGVEIDWSGVYERPAELIALPPYPFQRQRLWSESNESRRTRLAPSHPLLGESTDQPTRNWQSRIDLGLHQIFRDHRVRGSSVLPAAAMIETAIAAARTMGHSGAISLGRFQFDRPGLLSEDHALQFQTSYDENRGKLSFAARVIDDDHWTQLATVDLLHDASPSRTLANSLDEVRSRLPDVFDSERCYAYCDRLGLQYGNRFRGIVGGVRRAGEAVSEVEVETAESFQYRDGVDPALLDSCFHTMIVADPNFDHSVQGLFLPAQIERLHFLRAVPTRVRVHARIRLKTAQRLLADLDVFDERGEPCLLIRGFLSKRIGGGENDETVRDWLYRYRWIPAELADGGIVSVSKTAVPTWCVMADRGGFARQLADELRHRGDRVIWIDHGDQYTRRGADHFVIDPQRPTDFQQLIGDAFPGDASGQTHWLYLWGLDAPSNDQLDCSSLDRSTIVTTLAPMHLVQAWNQRFESRSAKLTVFTAGAQSPDDALQPVTVAQLPLIGFSRVIASEFSSFRSRLIDLPRDVEDASPSFVGGMVRELTNETDREDEVMYREGTRYAHRFTPSHDVPLPSDAAQQLQSRLEIGETKGMDDLRYRSQPVGKLGTNEVEIQVAATGLNFSDVMKALHLYPSDTELAPTLGSECSGIITRVGSGVTDWAVGDQVMAVAPGSFATHTVVSASLVARKPSRLSFEQAAAIPIAFLTAVHALEDCARLGSGETLLVHAASGGVGLAAMQLAKIAGARIFATAGSDEKRAFVKRQGAELVMDSRSLAFVDQVSEATGNEGVDVILNSLPGEAIARGLGSLRVGGRFLEIGKRDIYDDHPLGMYPLRNNLALHAIDLDQLFKIQPERMGRKLREVSERFEREELQPLPIRTWDADQTDAAFRFMQQAKHIGKVVVRFETPPQSVFAGEQGEIGFVGTGTYWIIGGLGGFGLEVARWLAGHGVKTLVLSGRSASLSPEAREAIESLKAGGVAVHVIPSDVTDRASVDLVLQRIQRELPPLKGVVHAAMVLEDRLLIDLDRDTLERVLRPKVLGGWNLHEATGHLDLDHFLLFSSLSSVFGHAGQANYSAANSFLDGLAFHRRSLGLPATVINWGHLGEVGYLARREELGDRLRRQGVLSFSVEQAFQSLEHALQNGLIQTSVLRMDWSVWRGLGISGDVSLRFAHLIHQSGGSDSGVASADQIRQADGNERFELVGEMLRFKVGSLLGIKEDQLDNRRCLIELGLDSLMAVELRNWIESQIQVALPIARLMRDTSLVDLVELICARVAEENTAERHVPSSAEAGAELGRIESADAIGLLETLPGMPADEITTLLTQLLREQESSPDER